MEDLYKRLARAEAMTDAQRDELNETIETAYSRACNEHSEEDAALFARKLRNKMLDESDCQMSLDRFNLSIPSDTTLEAWLQFLKDLGEIITGDWAKYRKDLRDLPEQPGFPFDIEFPKKPEVK